jgi:hypothetical protein
MESDNADARSTISHLPTMNSNCSHDLHSEQLLSLGQQPECSKNDRDLVAFIVAWGGKW